AVIHNNNSSNINVQITINTNAPQAPVAQSDRTLAIGVPNNRGPIVSAALAMEDQTPSVAQSSQSGGENSKENGQIKEKSNPVVRTDTKIAKPRTEVFTVA